MRIEELVKSIDAFAETVKREWQKLKRNMEEVVEILSSKRLLGLLRCRHVVQDFAGVDGSMAELVRLRSGSLFLVKAVRVESTGEAESVEDIVYAMGGGEEVREYATFAMMKLEAQLAQKAKAKLVVLDGPLVDPPYTPRFEPASRDFSKYHEWRAKILESLKTRGKTVIGFTKAVGSQRLLDRLIGGWHSRLGDADKAYILLKSYLEEHDESYCGAYLAPLEPPARPPFSVYHGLRIAFIYVRWWDDVARLELFASNMGEALEAVASLTSHKLPAPAPVLLAHKRASISKSVVRAFAQRLMKSLPTLHP